jgi:hypothetical protein
MNLMLTVIFSCLAIGLIVRRVGVREHLLILGIATVMTFLYFFVGRTM